MAYSFSLPAARRGQLALAALLGLAGAARAQSYNAGAAYNAGSLYHAGRFNNDATGSFANVGSSALVYYAGAGAAFLNVGSYAASAGATDRFVGPGNAAGPQALAGTTAPAFHNLTLANGSGQAFDITNAAGVDVANVLTLSNGKTTTPTTVAGAIRLGSSAPAVAGTLGASAGYVDGYVGKTGPASFLYPLGAGNQNAARPGDPAPGAVIYSPITLSSPGGTTLRYVAASAPSNTSFTPGDAQPLVTVSAREHYPMGLGAAPAGSTITMPYGNFTNSYVGNPATLTIAALNSGTGRWENLSNTATNPTSGSAVTVTLNKTLSSAYTALALASTTSSNPLPVELTTFAATKRGDDGQLTWQTASEKNSAYFEVQTSLDGAAWQALGTVTATGTSSAARAYGYLDKAIGRHGVPVVYYRLRQVDVDGKARFSPVVNLTVGALAWKASAYPNPFEAELTTRLTTPDAGPVTLTVLDATGRTVLRRETTAIAGSQDFALDEVRSLPPGFYTLLVHQSGHLGTIRIIRE